MGSTHNFTHVSLYVFSHWFLPLYNAIMAWLKMENGLSVSVEQVRLPLHRFVYILHCLRAKDVKWNLKCVTTWVCFVAWNHDMNQQYSNHF